jgi:heat-inducible transcriptional repressor
MNEREQTILRLVVEEYIKNAEPVGSKFLSEAAGLDVSSATIRNDMASLESQGYLRRPHPSAGAVPTEKAYLYYLQNCLKTAGAASQSRHFQDLCHATHDEDTVRTLAKALVDLSGEMAIVAFAPSRSYYTGVANLFNKPDFRDLTVIRSLSEMVDRFDEVIGEIFETVSADPQVLIGSQNPFGPDMSAILVKKSLPGGVTGLLGLVGPMRMDYERNLKLLSEAADALNDDPEYV